MKRRTFIKINVIAGILTAGGLESLIAKEKTPVQKLAELKKILANDKILQRAGVTKEEINTYFLNLKFKDYYTNKKYINIEKFFKLNPEKRSDNAGEKIKDFKKKKDAQEKAYKAYRKIHAIDELKEHSVNFYKKYKGDLHKAEEIYGVDWRYIIATLGIETQLGKRAKKDSYGRPNRKAFNTLVSIYTRVNTSRNMGLWTKENGKVVIKKVKKPWSTSFGLPQLKYLILYAHKQNEKFEKNKEDIIFAPSSYAGCIGNGQFTPESLLKLYVGKDRTFNADLFDLTDSIYAVANYYRSKGWKKELNHKDHEKDSSLKRKVYSVIRQYNNSFSYIRAIIEIANTAKWPFEKKIEQTLKKK